MLRRRPGHASAAGGPGRAPTSVWGLAGGRSTRAAVLPGGLAAVGSGGCRGWTERLGWWSSGRMIRRGLAVTLGRWSSGRMIRRGLAVTLGRRPGRLSELGKRLSWQCPALRRLGRRRRRIRWSEDRPRHWREWRRLRRRKLRIDQGPGPGQRHDEIVNLRFESVKARTDRGELRIGVRGLLFEPGVNMAAQVAAVGTQPPEARTARTDENGKRNSQQRGEDSDFHGKHCNRLL